MSTIEFPFPAEVFWAATLLIGLVAASALVFAVLSAVKPGPGGPPLLARVQEQLGLGGLHPVVALLAVMIWGALFLLLLAGLFWVIASVIASDIPADRAATWDFRFALAKLTALTAVLGAVVALPFTITRLRLMRQQTQTADESLFNDKINAASQALSARRTMTRRVRTVSFQMDGEAREMQEIKGEPLTLPHAATALSYGPWACFSEEEDDLVTRAAAIDRLEGLANERPEEAPRIARMLSVYVRELSREFPAKEHPRYEWLRLFEGNKDNPPIDADQIFWQTGITPEEASIDALGIWVRSLEPIRPDMEKAAQTLGRQRGIENVDKDKIEIDLRKVNLQGSDLSRLNFSTVDLTGARLEGADLRKTQFEGANLTAANLIGSDLRGARFEGAILNAARFDVAKLRDTRPHEGNSHFRGAAVRATDFSNARDIRHHLEHMFGDRSTKLPRGIARPELWSRKKLAWPEFEKAWRDWQRRIGYTPKDRI